VQNAPTVALVSERDEETSLEPPDRMRGRQQVILKFRLVDNGASTPEVSQERLYLVRSVAHEDPTGPPKHHSGMVSDSEPAALTGETSWRPEPPSFTVKLSDKTTTTEEDANG
jgi:hypothetical protein